jgi:hypothetical protein
LKHVGGEALGWGAPPVCANDILSKSEHVGCAVRASGCLLNQVTAARGSESKGKGSVMRAGSGGGQSGSERARARASALGSGRGKVPLACMLPPFPVPSHSDWPAGGKGLDNSGESPGFAGTLVGAGNTAAGALSSANRYLRALTLISRAGQKMPARMREGAADCD